MARPKLYIFDLDGTLADLSHRLHYIKPPLDPRLCHPKEAIERHKGWKKDWKGFFAACGDDLPIEWVVNLLGMIHGSILEEDMILVLSGRSNATRSVTEAWLNRNGIAFDRLIMRPEGDFRPDEVLKLEMLRVFLEANGLYESDVRFIVDDRQKVVDMWRENGFNVLQCAAWREDGAGG